MKLTMSEKYMFCNQMAMILESGFSLNQGVTMVYEEMDDKNIKGVLQEVAKAASVKTPLHIQRDGASTKHLQR